MKITYKTDVGNIREINEDSYAIDENSLNHILCLVADGMGGHNAGEVASSMAKETIKEEFLKANYKDVSIFLKEVILKANTTIYSTSLIDEKYSKMGTTLSIVILDEEKIYIGHVGDSRVYYFNKEIGKIYQLTKDHTMVQMLYEQGHLKKDELRNHPYKNVLAQSLGTSKKLTADIMELKMPKGGYILICSDGLTDEVDDQIMYKVITQNEILEVKAQTLLDKALNNKGKDNITFILIER